MYAPQENILNASQEFNKSLEGKIYHLAPMPNFKHHMNALIALCVSQHYLGVTTATAHYLRAKSLNSYTVKIPSYADGFGYIEPVLYPGEKIEKIELFVNDSCELRVCNPEGNKIYLYSDTYIPTSLFGLIRPELEITISNIMYPTEKRLVWIDGLYLQPKERGTFFRLADDVTGEIFPDLRDSDSGPSSETENTTENTPIKPKNENEKNLQCPICLEYSIFLDRGLCSQGHTYPILNSVLNSGTKF